MFSSGRQVYEAGLTIVGSSLRSSIFYLTIAMLACLALPRPGNTNDSATKEGQLEQVNQISVAGVVTHADMRR